MKKLSLLIVLSAVFSAIVSAQGIYIRAGAGYGLPSGTSQVGEKYLHLYDASNTEFPDSYSSEIVTGSYGAGMNFQVAFGYKFNENLILDFNVQYLAGNKIKTSDIYRYEDGSFSGVDQSTTETGSNSLFLNPSVVFSAGFGKGAPYGRFGIVASSPTLTEKTESYYDLDGISTSSLTWKYSKGLSLGYQAAIGMNWKLSEKLDFYTEVNFVSLTWYAKEGEITEYIEDGNDILDQFPTYFKKVVFEKEYDPQGSFIPEEPQVLPRNASPFSAVSAQAGIRFSLWQVSK